MWISAFKTLSAELQDPLTRYGPPAGVLLLAYWQGKPAGCIALQPLQHITCEMKRLYVHPAFRQHGIGDELVKKLLQMAKKKGFRKMVLDTLDRLQAAIKLYQRHGFTFTTAYYANPLAGVVYLEKVL